MTAPGEGIKPVGAADGTKPAEKPVPTGLHVVSTPIGNLGDITLRALATLAAANLVACEDTRVTGRLLKAHGISAPMAAYHEHNAARVRPRLIERLKYGEIVALVSDAGTPLISDPGYRLVREAADAGIRVSVEPGPSAPLAALVVSGLPTDRFLFAGFLPTRAVARRAAIAGLAAVEATLVFLESPRRLAGALADMADGLGAREACVARELTKLYEEVRRDSLAALAAHYRDAPPPKGEAVVVVGPPAAPSPPDEAEIDARLTAALATMSVRDAAATVAAETGLPRRRLYARAMAIAADDRGDGDV